VTDEEHKWIETNNSVCALLRQAHDVLAMSSFPPRRTWVGLTDEDWKEIEDMPDTFDQGVAWAQRRLKEKNT